MLELFPSFPYWVGSSTFLQIVCPQVIGGVGDSTITRNATQRSHKMGGWEARLWSLLGAGRRMLCDRKSKGGRLGTRLAALQLKDLLLFSSNFSLSSLEVRLGSVSKNRAWVSLHFTWNYCCLWPKKQNKNISTFAPNVISGHIGKKGWVCWVKLSGVILIRLCHFELSFIILSWINVESCSVLLR